MLAVVKLWRWVCAKKTIKHEEEEYNEQCSNLPCWIAQHLSKVRCTFTPRDREAFGRTESEATLVLGGSRSSLPIYPLFFRVIIVTRTQRQACNSYHGRNLEKKRITLFANKLQSGSRVGVQFNRTWRSSFWIFQIAY